MRRTQVSGEIAVVATTAASARSAAAALAALLPEARLVPLGVADYLEGEALAPAILAPAGSDREADRRFLERARVRILWPAPPGDLYAAIEGVVSSLPPRPAGRAARTRNDLATALLLEGDVDSERAQAASASGVRRWIVEHPGRVKLSDGELADLRERGVVWSALRPVTLVGVALRGRSGSSPFPGARVWRLRNAGSRARARTPSPR